MRPGRIFRAVKVMGSVLLASAALSGCALGAAQSTSDGPTVPTFAASSSSTSAAPTGSPRASLLPHDCDQALSHEQVPALLGLPLDSVEVHTTIGVAEPAVRRVERVTCTYRRIGGGPGLLDFTMSAYADAAAARSHSDINLAAEQRSAGPGLPSPIGQAGASYFVDGDQRILMVTYGRSALTVALQGGVVDDGAARAVVVDLAQRVLPALTA